MPQAVTKDGIVDTCGAPITIDTRVIGPYGQVGSVTEIHSVSDNEGGNPGVVVHWSENGWDELETFETSVSDFKRQGPSGPFVYCCDELEVAR